MGWDGMGWDGMGWEMGWDGMGWDGMSVLEAVSQLGGRLGESRACVVIGRLEGTRVKLVGMSEDLRSG
jgi:hypothetical protein